MTKELNIARSHGQILKNSSGDFIKSLSYSTFVETIVNSVTNFARLVRQFDNNSAIDMLYLSYGNNFRH